jgi:hypothetical protein
MYLVYRSRGTLSKGAPAREAKAQKIPDAVVARADACPSKG